MNLDVIVSKEVMSVTHTHKKHIIHRGTLWTQQNSLFFFFIKHYGFHEPTIRDYVYVSVCVCMYVSVYLYIIIKCFRVKLHKVTWTCDVNDTRVANAMTF